MRLHTLTITLAAVALMAPALPLVPAAASPGILLQEAVVQVGDDFFAARTIRVTPGTTIIWRTVGSNGHTVTSDTGLFDSGISPFLRQGDTFQFTFNDPGSYGYYCLFHGGPGGIAMAGTVIVEAATPAPTPAPTSTATPSPPPEPSLTPSPTTTPTQTATEPPATSTPTPTSMPAATSSPTSPPAPSRPDSADDDDGASTTATIAGAAILVAIALAAVWWLVRRRR